MWDKENKINVIILESHGSNKNEREYERICLVSIEERKNGINVKRVDLLSLLDNTPIMKWHQTTKKEIDLSLHKNKM